MPWIRSKKESTSLKSGFQEAGTNTNAIKKVSLPGAERRSNPNKNEIATPFGLAMTCNDIYCVRINILLPNRMKIAIIPGG
jgi:hypothetical protein